MRKYLTFVVPLGCALFFLVMATVNIYFPGLHYDEVLFINTALGNLDGTFVAKCLGPLPIFAMPYVGSLKGWLYWPIMKVFGVSIWSIRLPLILGGVAGLVGYFYLAKKYCGQRTAWMATSLLAVNATFVWGTRVDYSGLEFPLQVFALFAFLAPIPLWPALVLFLLGIFSKMVISWWVGGILCGAFFAFPHLRRKAAVAGIALLAYVVFWYWYVDFPLQNELVSSFGTRWEQFISYCSRLATGTAFYTHVMYKTPVPELFGKIIVAGILLGVGYRIFFHKTDAMMRFLVISILATATVTFLSARAVSFWHIIPLLPFFLLLAAILFSRMGKWGLAAWGAYFLFTCAVHLLTLRNTPLEPENKTWTMGIYPLVAWCSEGNRRCASVEWGTHTQLLAFIRDSSRVFEFQRFPRLESGVSYVTSADSRTRAQEKARFFSLAKEAGWQANLRQRIFIEQAPAYDIFELVRP